MRGFFVLPLLSERWQTLTVSEDLMAPTLTIRQAVPLVTHSFNVPIAPIRTVERTIPVLAEVLRLLEKVLGCHTVLTVLQPAVC